MSPKTCIFWAIHKKWQNWMFMIVQWNIAFVKCTFSLVLLPTSLPSLVWTHETFLWQSLLLLFLLQNRFSSTEQQMNSWQARPLKCEQNCILLIHAYNYKVSVNKILWLLHCCTLLSIKRTASILQTCLLILSML